MSLPFRVAHGADVDHTHLVLGSPAVPGHRPDQLAPEALCGRAVTSPANTPIGAVHCTACLLRAPGFLALPGFGLAA